MQVLAINAHSAAMQLVDRVHSCACQANPLGKIAPTSLKDMFQAALRSSYACPVIWHACCSCLLLMSAAQCAVSQLNRCIHLANNATTLAHELLSYVMLLCCQLH
ncbi:TPA: hypothetical protein ACH3X3_015145 [Trebouxia sp. C0006]